MQAWTISQSTPIQGSATILSMRKATTPAQYRQRFFERVRAARTLAGKNPLEMAQLLDVPKDTYHRYETRTLLPHHLIPVFCQITGVEIEWLVRGLRRGIDEQPGSASATKVA